MRFIIILIIAMLIFTIWAISTGNKIKILKVKIDEAKSGIDIALIKRYDILTESLNVAKGYAAHEKNLMLQLVKARLGMSLKETHAVIENQEKVLHGLKVIAESYPQLYSNEMFKELQGQIAVTNEHLSAAKRVLNSNISLYNSKIAAFPASIIAVIIGCRRIEFFKEADEKKKQDVHMEF